MMLNEYTDFSEEDCIEFVCLAVSLLRFLKKSMSKATFEAICATSEANSVE